MFGLFELFNGQLTVVITMMAAVGVGFAVWGLIRAFWDQKERQDERVRGELRGVPCPHCRSMVDRRSTLCPHCYRDLKVNCPGCGETVSVKAERCPHCQSALEPQDDPRDRQAHKH